MIYYPLTFDVMQQIHFDRTYKINIKIVKIYLIGMLCPPIIEHSQYYLHSDIQLTSTPRTNPNDIINLENRACSSLCELSANICKDDNTDNTRSLQKEKCFSPWIVKKAQNKDTSKYQNRRINQDHKCSTENKQNQDSTIRVTNQQEMLRHHSIFFKIAGSKEPKRTLHLKQEHLEFQMIACMNRKKSSLSDIPQSIPRKNDKLGMIAQINRQITPKLITLEHRKEEGIRQGPKKQDLGELDKNNFEFLSEHWKGRQKRNKLNRKIVSRQMKSIEARQVRETCLVRKRGSASLDGSKKEKESYHSNNALTRLLYQKYLHTIGVNPSVKQKCKFL